VEQHFAKRGKKEIYTLIGKTKEKKRGKNTNHKEEKIHFVPLEGKWEKRERGNGRISSLTLVLKGRKEAGSVSIKKGESFRRCGKKEGDKSHSPKGGRRER